MRFIKTRKWFKLTKDFFHLVSRHNLLFLSASVSYYAALALAPFLLIILAVASLTGEKVQENIINQAQFMAPQAGQVVALVFDNINDQVNIGSISGIIGTIILLFTASVVFVHLRHSLDIIYGYHNVEHSKSFRVFVKERLFLMFLVIILSIVLIFSIFIPTIFEYLFGVNASDTMWGSILLGYCNFLIFLSLFSVFYYYAPSKKQKFIDCIKTSLVSSTGFLMGKELIGLYMKNFASASVYGAAGALLVFLVWVYYSSFIIFISVELFLFGRKAKHERRERKLNQGK